MIIKQNISIKTDLENSIQKLKTVPVQEWKDTITDLLDQNSAFDTLEQVLDIISPIKSPVKFEASWEDVEIQGYSLSSRILGEGQNKVRLATHQKTKQIVAVKCIDRIKLKKDKISCTGVVRELLVWGSLKHPHICPLLEVIDSVDSIYMVMEYQPGGDLFSYLEKGRLPEQKACFLFRQIIQGIQYCHSQSVVHRDLKPENIVFDSQGNIKICDFGFSNMIKKNVGFVEFCGSPEYAAPEMIARKPYAGPEVDIWSIGVILYVMVTATMPFGETNVSRLFVSIMMGKYSIPDYVSASCKSLISSILKPQPSQRATLESIRVHEWTNQNGQSLLQFVDETVRNPSEYLASSTKDELKKMGFSDSDIQEYLEKESPGPIKAAVFLIRQASRPRKMPQLEVPVHIEARPPTIVTKYTQSNNLFAQIRKERSIAPKTAPYIITDRPPVISTTQHRFNIQQTQLLILRNLKHLGGHISEFDDENPNTLYGSLKIKERSMFGDHSDPEIAACFQGDQMEMLFSAVGDQLGINEFQTKFELLNGYDKEWVFEEFDKIVNQLLRGVS